MSIKPMRAAFAAALISVFPANAALAGPAFPSFALAPQETALQATPLGLTGFDAAPTTPKLDIAMDLRPRAEIDTPPVRAASVEWEQPTPRLSLAAKRMIFDGESRPQIVLERRYERDALDGTALDWDE